MRPVKLHCLEKTFATDYLKIWLGCYLFHREQFQQCGRLCEKPAEALRLMEGVPG